MIFVSICRVQALFYVFQINDVTPLVPVYQTCRTTLINKQQFHNQNLAKGSNMNIEYSICIIKLLKTVSSNLLLHVLFIIKQQITGIICRDILPYS